MLVHVPGDTSLCRINTTGMCNRITREENISYPNEFPDISLSYTKNAIQITRKSNFVYVLYQSMPSNYMYRHVMSRSWHM